MPSTPPTILTRRPDRAPLTQPRPVSLAEAIAEATAELTEQLTQTRAVAARLESFLADPARIAELALEQHHALLTCLHCHEEVVAAPNRTRWLHRGSGLALCEILHGPKRHAIPAQPEAAMFGVQPAPQD